MRDLLTDPPVTVRLLLVGGALLLHGPRVAIFAMLALESLAALLCLLRGALRRAIPAPRSVIVASRDDGVVVRWLGRLSKGNLIPLPAALVGLAATAIMARLGMGHVPGFIVLAPLVVLLLAAPGGGHVHNGRLDWLVPAVLQAAQYIYLAALGLDRGVPAPLVYSLIALTVVWYASLAAPPPPSPVARLAEIGWEGRMFVAALSVMLGLVTFGYVVLAAYLGLLVGRKFAVGYAMGEEEASVDRDGSGGGRRAAAPS